MILYQARVNGEITMTRNNVNYVYNPLKKVGKQFLEVFSSFSLENMLGILHTAVSDDISSHLKKKNSSSVFKNRHRNLK